MTRFLKKTFNHAYITLARSNILVVKAVEMTSIILAVGDAPTAPKVVYNLSIYLHLIENFYNTWSAVCKM